ncbi:MAG TPA: sialidase family protein [Jiangellaceae bacterium]
MRRLTIILSGTAILIPLAVSPVFAGPLAATTPAQVTDTSPFDPACGLAGQDTGSVVFVDSEVEPWIAVSSANPQVMAGTWQQDRWNDGGSRGNLVALSVDGGTNWESFVPPNITECTANSGVASSFALFDRASDPWLDFAPNGDLHLMHLVFDVALPEGKPGALSGRNGMAVQTVRAASLADGVIEDFEWEAPILLVLDEGGDLHDKNTLTADPTVGAGTHVYAVWDFLEVPEGGKINPERGSAGFGFGFKGRALFTRTTDGGKSWEAPRVIYDPGGTNQTIGNQIVVRPDGTLVNVFNEILNFRDDDRGMQFDFNVSLKFSPDKGETWLPRGRPIRAAKMLPRTLFTPAPFVGVYHPDAVGAETFARANAVRTADVIPEVAVDPNNGNLYVVWQDARFSSGGNFSDPSQLVDDIAITMSTDGGRTWTTPIKVNQTPDDVPLGNRQAFIPMVRVNDDGVVAVSYYDFRNNDPTDRTETQLGAADTDLFVVHCHANCSDPASWTPNNEVRVTDSSFDTALLPFANGFFPGDYVGFGTDGTDFLPFYTESVSMADPASQFFSRVSVGNEP